MCQQWTKWATDSSAGMKLRSTALLETKKIVRDMRAACGAVLNDFVGAWRGDCGEMLEVWMNEPNVNWPCEDDETFAALFYILLTISYISLRCDEAAKFSTQRTEKEHHLSVCLPGRFAPFLVRCHRIG